MASTGTTAADAIVYGTKKGPDGKTDIVLTSEQVLQRILYKWCGVPKSGPGRTTNSYLLCLNGNGVLKFDDFLILSEKDLSDLRGVNPSTGDPTQLKSHEIRRLQAIQAFFHAGSRALNQPIKIANVAVTDFDKFRVSEFVPSAQIIPWKLSGTSGKTVEEVRLEEWDRRIKPNKTEFKELRDEKFYTKWAQDFITVLKSQGLGHTINDKFTPTHIELDERQCQWTYNLMTTKIQAAAFKRIVLKHKPTDSTSVPNTRAIWKEIQEYAVKSQLTKITGQTLSSYLTSTRLHQVEWRGTKTAFIHNWAEQARLYNEISKEQYTDYQLIEFLNSCVAGTAVLQSVLTLYNTAEAAAGSSGRSLSFSEYVSRLIDAAATIDAGNTPQKNPRSQRSANAHEIEFEDDPQELNDVLELNVHDANTPIEELQVMQMRSSPQRSFPRGNQNRGPRKVMMDRDTWRKLSPEDRKSWDLITETGKTDILGYAKARTLREVNLTNTNGDNRQVNVNEFIFEDDDDIETSREVSAHHLQDGAQEAYIEDPETRIVQTTEHDGDYHDGNILLDMTSGEEPSPADVRVLLSQQSHSSNPYGSIPRNEHDDDIIYEDEAYASDSASNNPILT